MLEEVITPPAIDYTGSLVGIEMILEEMKLCQESIYTLQFLTTLITATVAICLMAYYILKKFY